MLRMGFNQRSHRRATFAKRYLHIVEIQDTNFESNSQREKLFALRLQRYSDFCKRPNFCLSFFCGQKKQAQKIVPAACIKSVSYAAMFTTPHYTIF